MSKFIYSLNCLMVLSLASAAAEKVPKELAEYVVQARHLGLDDQEIKKSAVVAGWKPSLVEQLFAGTAQLPQPGTPETGPEARTGYRIGPGDVLQITVWKEPEASVPEIAVRADGKISVPLIKEVEAAGITPGELEQRLAAKLGKFINAVDVTVVVRQVRSKKLYVVGGVKKEGPVALESPLTVLQAIVAAGGLTDYAKAKKIYVLRTVNGRQVRLAFDYQAVIKGQRMEQNVVVAPDDTIVVPQ
jgi:polysaccharide export outer membrane protein